MDKSGSAHMPASASSPTQWNRRDLLVALLLIAAVVVLYWPVRHFTYVNIDDPTYLFDNPIAIHGLTRRSVHWALTSLFIGNYMPVAELSSLLDVSIWGMNPGAMHLENALIHGISTVGWYLLWVKLTGCRGRSFMVAGLFGLHPMHVEPVAWIVERCDLLAMLLMVGSLLAYVQYTRTARKWLYALSILLFPLALLAKTVAMTLPLVVLLLNVWPLRRLRWPGRWQLASPASSDAAHAKPVAFSRLLLEMVPFILLGMGGAAMGLWGRLSSSAIRSVASWPLYERWAVSVLGYCRYLLKFVWPEPMVVLYPLGAQRTVLSMVVATVLLGIVSVLIVRSARKWPYLLVGWIWFLGTLAPTIGLVQAGGQAIADRYTYLPYVGLSMAIVWWAADAWRQIARGRPVVTSAVSWSLCGAVLVMSSVDARHQLMYWKNSLTLFRHADQNTVDNFAVDNSLGNEYRRQGRYDLATQAYAKSVAADPGHPDSQNNLAGMLMMGYPAQALPHFEIAVHLDPKNPDRWWNLGQCFEQLHHTADAMHCYRIALKLNPHYEPALHSLRAMQTKSAK